MKHHLGIVLFLIAACASIVLGIILFSPETPKTVEIIIPRGARNAAGSVEEAGEFSAYLYTDHAESSYFVASELESAKIVGEDGLIKLNDPTFEQTGAKQKIANKEYAELLVKGTISLSTDLEIEEASLVLSFKDLETIEIAIGCFTYTFLPKSSGSLRVSSLSALVKDGRLTALQMSFSSDAVIKELKLADLNIKASLGEASRISEPLSPSEELESVVGEDYDPLGEATPGVIAVAAGERWLVPVKRTSDITPHAFALWMKYDEGGVLVLSKRIFYSSTDAQYERTVVEYA